MEHRSQKWQENYGKESGAAPLEEQKALPNTNENTGKEAAKSGSQVSQELTSWVPEMDNIHSSAKEREAGLTFESVYNSLLYPNWSPSLLTPYKNRRRLPVFKDIEDGRLPSLPSEKYDGDLPAKENLPLPKINQGTGKETEVIESGSQCTEFLTASSVVKMLPETMESNKTEREKIDLSSSQAQNPSNTGAVTAILELKAPEITGLRAETENHDNRRRQRRKEKRVKVNSAPLFKNWWDKKPCNHPGAPESNASFDLGTWPELTNTPVTHSINEMEFGSSMPSIPSEKHDNDLPAKENLPLPKINQGTGKETEVIESGSQCTEFLTASSVVKMLPDRVPQMDSIHPSAKEQGARIIFGSFNCSLHPVWSPHLPNPHRSSQGSQELTSSSAPSIQQASVVPAEENLPLPKINKDTGKETEVRERMALLPDTMEHRSQKWQENYGKELGAAPLEEQKALPNTNENTGKEAAKSGSQVSQELTSWVPAMDNIHSSAKEREAGLTFESVSNSLLYPNSSLSLLTPYKNRRRLPVFKDIEDEMEFGSSMPSLPSEKYDGDLPAKENLPLPKINQGTGKETEVIESGSQCTEFLTASSVVKMLPETMESNKTEREKIDLSSSQAQNPSNTGAVTAILELKAPEITGLRAETENHDNRRRQRRKEKRVKVNSAPVFEERWVVRKPGNHPGAPESNAPLDFNTGTEPAEQFPASPKIDNNTETETESGSQQLTASSKPHTPVEQHASSDTLPAEHNPPILNVSKNSGKVTDSGSQCSQELTASSLPKVPVKKVDAEEHTSTTETTVKKVDAEEHNNRISQRQKENMGKANVARFFENLRVLIIDVCQFLKKFITRKSFRQCQT